MAPRPKVAVIKADPKTVWEDVGRVMRLADYERFLPRGPETALKINITWQVWYPGCSTTPWQLEGVTRALLEDGYERDSLIGVHNRTVVVDSKVGEINNKHAPVLRKMGVGWVHTFEEGVGILVDANLAEESAKLQALQTKEQLGIQSLSIANQRPQSIMSLFK